MVLPEVELGGVSGALFMGVLIAAVVLIVFTTTLASALVGIAIVVVLAIVAYYAIKRFDRWARGRAGGGA